MFRYPVTITRQEAKEIFDEVNAIIGDAHAPNENWIAAEATIISQRYGRPGAVTEPDSDGSKLSLGLICDTCGISRWDTKVEYSDIGYHLICPDCK
ncbi:MAG: hypothetical protein D6816_16295 [Bacteroidetes bacterium]|nr:MAG: hypothetical protein D6816_16295 [Bacteroidota bacterium]